MRLFYLLALCAVVGAGFTACNDDKKTTEISVGENKMSITTE